MTATTNAGPGHGAPLGPGQLQPDLSQEYIALLRRFENVWITLNNQTAGMQACPEAINVKQTLNSLDDQRGRFRIWGKNVDAEGVDNKASLSHQLREAPHIRALVYELFQNIQELLTEGSFSVHLALLKLELTNLCIC